VSELWRSTRRGNKKLVNRDERLQIHYQNRNIYSLLLQGLEFVSHAIQFNLIANYSFTFKINFSSRPVNLYNRLKSNLYTENRRRGLGFFYDNSTNMRGKQSIQNRLPYFRLISDQWINNEITMMQSECCWKNHFLLIVKPDSFISKT